MTIVADKIAEEYHNINIMYDKLSKIENLIRIKLCENESLTHLDIIDVDIEFPQPLSSDRLITVTCAEGETVSSFINVGGIAFRLHIAIPNPQENLNKMLNALTDILHSEIIDGEIINNG